MPTHLFESYKLSFTPKEGQTAIRVMLGYSNAKISLTVDGHDGVIVESKPQDDGRSQLLIAEDLAVDTSYTLHFEFSEREADLDGQGALSCETFVLAVKTWDSRTVCQEGLEKSYSDAAMYTSPGDEPIN